jgi:preprotein translocase subunit SecA
MRRFGGPAVARVMDRLGVDEDIPIEHDMVTRALQNAQIRVEGHNFDVRKHLLEYDDVVNQQRQVIYEQRRLVLSEANLRPLIVQILETQIDEYVDGHTQGYEEDWALRELHQAIHGLIGLPPTHGVAKWETMGTDEIKDELYDLVELKYDAKEAEIGPEMMRRLERMVMLQAIDSHWMRHLTALDELREGIGLRAVGQRNPLVEYKREAFTAFEQLLDDIQATVAGQILRPVQEPRRRRVRPTRFSGARGGQAPESRPASVRRKKSDVGRNSPCPCGSGRKYKQCCLPKGLSPEEAAAQGTGRARERTRV